MAFCVKSLNILPSKSYFLLPNRQTWRVVVVPATLLDHFFYFQKRKKNVFIDLKSDIKVVEEWKLNKVT